MAGRKSSNEQQKIATTAHLLSTIGDNLGHASRHTNALKRSKTAEEKQFNLEHVSTHIRRTAEHYKKLILHIQANYPEVAREQEVLKNVSEPKPKRTIKR